MCVWLLNLEFDLMTWLRRVDLVFILPRRLTTAGCTTVTLIVVGKLADSCRLCPRGWDELLDWSLWCNLDLRAEANLESLCWESLCILYRVIKVSIDGSWSLAFVVKLELLELINVEVY